MTPFNRRLFLKSAAGIVVGLPLLESFEPKIAIAAPPAGFRYAIIMRQGNGVQQKAGTEPERFWPAALGQLTKAGMQAGGDRTVNLLSDYADKLLVVRGIKYSFSTSGCGHADGGLQCLTAAKPNGTFSNEALAMGESIDTRIVRALEPVGNEPLNLYAGQKSGYLDDVLSYRSATNRRAAEGNPFNAYKRLFGVPNADLDLQNKLATQRKSVNDVVRTQMQALMARPELSKFDQDRLKLHFESIRDLEVKLGCQLASTRYTEISTVPASTVDDDNMIEKIVAMQMDIIALAMSCGLTHAATLQVGNGNDQTQYLIDGIKQERFHHISHRINSDGSEGDPIPGADLKHHRIDQKFAGFFKYLLDRLAQYTTPTGTLLDDGVSVWTNDLAAGVSHSSNNLPYVCAGSAGGFLKTGYYVDAANVDQGRYVSNNKILNTIGAATGVKNAAGGPLDDFGDPTLEKGLVPQMLKV